MQFPIYWKFIKEGGDFINLDNQKLNQSRRKRIDEICLRSQNNSLSIENIHTNDATERLEESITKFYGDHSLSVTTKRPKTNVRVYMLLNCERDL